MSTETFEQSFTVARTPTVKVGNIRGKIEVFPGETGQVHVKATKHLNNGEADHTQINIVQNEEGHVIVETKYREGITGWFSFLHRPAKVEYTIIVPDECNLIINSVSGEAHVRGLAGELKIGSVSGALLAEDITGKLKLNTVSGKVDGKRLSGPLVLESVSGGVELRESDLPSLKANTVSGSLTLETPLGEGPYSVSSVSGNLTLIVPEHSNCTADVTSVSGTLHTNLPNAKKWKNSGHGHRHHWLKIGEGGPEIKLNSVSGALRVVTPEELETPSRPLPTGTQPDEQPTSTNRLEILERIARGELSVDEGLTFLQPT